MYSSKNRVHECQRNNDGYTLLNIIDFGTPFWKTLSGFGDTDKILVILLNKMKKILDITINFKWRTLINIYAPNQDNPEFSLPSKRLTSRKHAYIILTSLNPTFI